MASRQTQQKRRHNSGSMMEIKEFLIWIKWWCGDEKLSYACQNDIHNHISIVIVSVFFFHRSLSFCAVLCSSLDWNSSFQLSILQGFRRDNSCIFSCADSHLQNLFVLMFYAENATIGNFWEFYLRYYIRIAFWDISN